MMSSKEPEWTQAQQSFLQNCLKEVHEDLLRLYSFESSDLTVVLHSLAASTWKHADYQKEFKIRQGDAVLILLELADLDEMESDRPFLEFLETIEGGFRMAIGTALKLTRLEIKPGLDDSEILALTHLLAFCMMSIAELIIAEEALMNAQHPLFLEEWKSAYMFYPEKLIEFDGVRYLRSDCPASSHH